MRRFRRIAFSTEHPRRAFQEAPCQETPMCHDLDSRPPITPIAGGAVDGQRIELTAHDRNRLVAFRTRPTTPSDAGVVILPDVRGLHPFYEELALRFAERGIDALAVDYYGRTAGTGKRGDEFEHASHAERTTWAGISADIAAGVQALREDGVERVFTIGFCMGGRMSFLASTLALDLAGVIGLYGTLQGPWRNDAPAPLDRLDDVRSPVLGLFGGADQGITADAVAAFDRGLAERRVDHRIVTYPGAPHSFFDRKATDYAKESAAAWDEILGFIEAGASG
jgi:carboxymethylenebutenolidase